MSEIRVYRKPYIYDIEGKTDYDFINEAKERSKLDWSDIDKIVINRPDIGCVAVKKLNDEYIEKYGCVYELDKDTVFMHTPYLFMQSDFEADLVATIFDYDFILDGMLIKKDGSKTPSILILYPDAVFYMVFRNDSQPEEILLFDFPEIECVDKVTKEVIGTWRKEIPENKTEKN